MFMMLLKAVIVCSSLVAIANVVELPDFRAFPSVKHMVNSLSQSFTHLLLTN